MGNDAESKHFMLSHGKIHTLSIDIETFSPEDLSSAGVYRYAEHPAAELLLFGYSVNDGPVELVDVAMGEEIPPTILEALVDEDVEKWAFNANFERVFLSYWLGRHYPALLQKSGYTAVEPAYTTTQFSSSTAASPIAHASPRSLPASRANSQSSDSALGGRYIGEACFRNGSDAVVSENACFDASASASATSPDTSTWASGSSILFLRPDSWRCSMVWSAYLGLPQSLDQVSKVLDLPEKLEYGSRLIRFFCSPASSALEGPATPPLLRHLPQDYPEDWSRFRAYNKRDVEVELALRKRLSTYSLKPKLWAEYALDQRINDRGIAMDRQFIQQARVMADASRGLLLDELKELTHLANPNSVVQWKQWLASHGIHVESADHKALEKLLEDPFVPPEILPAIKKKLQYSRSSLKKYEAMNRVICRDDAARGMYRFYGAGRTGRFSGHLIQLQNLPRTGTDNPAELDAIRSLVRSGDYTTLTQLCEDVPETLSQLIRTAFVPRPGYKLYVADFSAIEARILAHLAGEHWREDIFQQGQDLYCASASRMFNVPVEKDGENAHLRRYGKIAELALGYGGSVGALQNMGADKFITTQDGLEELVKLWRASNPHIVKFWWQVKDAFLDSLKTALSTEVGKIRFHSKLGMVHIELPSGRNLCYPRVFTEWGKYGPDISYMTMVQGKWTRQHTYGARLVENIVQGIARDVLTEAMLRLERTHPEWLIVGHVHDEIIFECPPDTDMEELIAVMTQPPAWLPNLQLGAEGYVSEYYKK